MESNVRNPFEDVQGSGRRKYSDTVETEHPADLMEIFGIGG